MSTAAHTAAPIRRREAGSAQQQLRDTMNVEHLLAAVKAMHPQARSRSFVAQWWDGAALVPALLVDVDGRRWRAVAGPTGELLLLPRGSRHARRRLARTRRALGPAAAAEPAASVQRPHVAITAGGLPRTPLIYDGTLRRSKPIKVGRPGPRPPIRLGPAVDYRACSHIGCAAVVPLPEHGADPPCPRCGRR